MGKEIFCKECIIARGHPGVDFNKQGVCSLCEQIIPESCLDNYENNLKNCEMFYKFSPSEKDKYGCLLMLSGGKDSLFMLTQLLKDKKKPLAFTLDIPFESKTAKENIERAKSILDIDHISMSAYWAFKKMWKHIFMTAPNPQTAKLNSERICEACGNFIILSACFFAYKFEIPYVIYCADPSQVFFIYPDFKLTLEAMIDRVGVEVLITIFGEDVRAVLSEDNLNLPKIITPYVAMAEQYNAEEIINYLKKEGLYISSPIETHCSLWALYHYFAYKYYNCDADALVYAKNVRDGLIARNEMIEVTAELRDIYLEIAVKNKISQEEKTHIKKVVNKVTQNPREANWIFDQLLSMKKTADKLGIDLSAETK